MKNEPTGPPEKKSLSATAPVFRFTSGKSVPAKEAQMADAAAEFFSFNPRSQESTGWAQAKGKPQRQEKLLTEDDLYLATLLLEGETNGLLQDPSVASTIDVNNHPFNSIIIPSSWDPLEKHDGVLGNWGREVWAMTSLDPAQWHNGVPSAGLGRGIWGQHPLYPGANPMGFQQPPGVNSGPLVRYAGNQRLSYPGTPTHIHPLPIGPRPVLPGLGPQPLYSQFHHNPPRLPGGPPGHPPGPNVGVYNGIEMGPPPRPAFASSYVPFAQRPGPPPSMLSLSQEISQLRALQKDMNEGKVPNGISNQDSPGQGRNGPPPDSDLKFPERYELEVGYIPSISESHYTDTIPIDSDCDGDSDDGDSDDGDEPELKSRGVFLRGVPRTASYLEIFQNIRGGMVDQVSFQDREGPLMDINIFFTTHKAAKAYVDYVTHHGGIFWYSERLPSQASLIPSQDPGFLNMDEETAKAIQDNFTRCISIVGIPLPITELQVRADVQSQTRRFRIDYEAFEFRYVDTLKGRTATVDIRFPSIKLCMASVATLRGLKAYKECAMIPGRDECAGPLSELERKWRMDYEWCKSQGIFRDQRFPIPISREKERGSNRETN